MKPEIDGKLPLLAVTDEDEDGKGLSGAEPAVVNTPKHINKDNRSSAGLTADNTTKHDKSNAGSSVKPSADSETVIPLVRTTLEVTVQAPTNSNMVTPSAGAGPSTTADPVTSNMAAVFSNPVESLTSLLNKPFYPNQIEGNLWDVPSQMHDGNLWNIPSQMGVDGSQMNFNFDWNALSMDLEHEIKNGPSTAQQAGDFLFLPMNSEIGLGSGVAGNKAGQGVEGSSIVYTPSLWSNYEFGQKNSAVGQDGKGIPNVQTPNVQTQPSHPTAGNNSTTANGTLAPVNVATANAVTAAAVEQASVGGDKSAEKSSAAVENPIDKETIARQSKGEGVMSLPEKRSRKPARREVVALTDKEAMSTLPEWFTAAHNYLGDLDVEEWRACLESWVKLEKGIGLSEASLVSFIT